MYRFLPLALALRDVPDANVSWTDNNMVKHKHADVGVAVALPNGLITPVVRKAETKTITAIAQPERFFRPPYVGGRGWLGMSSVDRSKRGSKEVQGSVSC